MYYRKRNKTGVIALTVVIVTCLILLAYVIWPREETYENDTTADNPISSEDIWEEEDDDEEETSNNINTTQDSYYLIKNENGTINIYFCDENGKQTFLEETDILYEVLSESDQKAFDEGYRVNTRDQLFNLLQDYES